LIGPSPAPKRPLADATIRRIAVGIEKYWKDYAQPFLAVLYGTSTVKSLNDPLTAVSGVPHHALVEPVPLLMGHESGQMPRPVDQPTYSILAQGKQFLIAPFITRYHGIHKGHHGENRNHGIEKPLPTVDTSNRYSLIQPFILNTGHSSARDRSRSVGEPLTTVVTKAEHYLVEPTMCLDIRFRMLKNHELKRAQGFPDDYKITGNTTEQTKQIGNAVPVNTAKALTSVILQGRR